MPSKNGVECLEEIRALKALKNLPVIIYSTTANPTQVDASYDKGASLYLQKPSNFECIKKSMEGILSKSIASFFEQPSKAQFVLKLT